MSSEPAGVLRVFFPAAAKPLPRGLHGVAGPAAHRRRALWDGVLATLLGSALSLLLSGFVAGTSNNVFHLPILARLYELPEFAQDPFVQSLRAFASGLWMLLEGSAPWIEPAPLLLALFVAARLCTFAALMLMARSCGLRGRPALLAFAVAVALSPSLRGEAYAGQAGLFIHYFSHSELAAATSLLVFAAGMRRCFAWALLALGLTFFINAFMAVWCVPVLALMAAQHFRRRPLALRQAWPRLTLAAAGAALLALPVVWRMLSAGVLAGANAPAFDYEAFLAELYPYHFLASYTSPSGWAGLAVIAAVAWLATGALVPPAARRSLRLAWIACVGVYAVGIVLPWLTDSRLLLNLHLLRSSANLHFLAVLALSVVLVQALGRAWAVRRCGGAALLAVAALASKASLAGAVLLLLWRGRDDPLRWPASMARRVEPVLAVACALLVVAGQVMLAQRQHAINESLRRSIDEWRDLAQAIARQVPPGVPVMIPLQAAPGEPGPADAEVFEIESRHPVWVNAKRGAAVMWQPGYHQIWSQRMQEQGALVGWPQRLDYARRHGIGAIVERCRGLPQVAAERLLHRAGPWCAVSTREELS